MARAHVRSGDGDAIDGYLGVSDVFDRALASFAVAYADQVERDHAALRGAIDAGRIVATEQVTLPPDGESVTARVRFTANEAGARLFRFRVPPQEGEDVAQNNARDALLAESDVHVWTSDLDFRTARFGAAFFEVLLPLLSWWTDRRQIFLVLSAPLVICAMCGLKSRDCVRPLPSATEVGRLPASCALLPFLRRAAAARRPHQEEIHGLAPDFRRFPHHRAPKLLRREHRPGIPRACAAGRVPGQDG